MAYNENQTGNSVFDDLKEKFAGLEKKQQMVVVGLGAVFAFLIITRVFGSSPEPVKKQVQETPSVRKVVINADNNSEDDSSGFSAEGADEAILRRNFVTQTMGEFESLKEEFALKDQKRDLDVKAQQDRLKSLESELSESIRALNEDRRSFQQTISRQQEENARLIEDLKEQRIKEKETSGSIAQQRDFVEQKPIRVRNKSITQTPLGMSTGGVEGTPLVTGLTAGALGKDDGYRLGRDKRRGKSEDEIKEERKPFIPPLGFIKGTMLNGVDALTGGTPTPSLIRLEGKYKTAMNSTIILDGCFMLVEFQGDISTERAKGKPARMTCVYPDQGAVTYSLSGYVVDSEDGVEGVPGLFFEGHAGRIALAIAAEFATGLSSIVEQNQQTKVVSPDGVTSTVITGSEAKASIYGSASDSLDTLKDFLEDRVSRVVPFIRIDALREVHIVLLSGTELRNEGDAWSQLFKAE